MEAEMIGGSLWNGTVTQAWGKKAEVNVSWCGNPSFAASLGHSSSRGLDEIRAWSSKKLDKLVILP